MMAEAHIKKPFLRFKDDNGEEYPDWEEKKLGEVSDVRDGTHESPMYKKEGFPLITSKNLLKNGKISFESVNLISEIDYININKRSKVNLGDILFGMIGTIGNPVIVEDSDFAIKNVALIKEKSDLINKYLIFYLDSTDIKRQFHTQNAGGTQKFIALGLIRKLKINTPSLPEQKKIADFLSSVDQKIQLLEKKKEQLELYKKGLMQQLFTQQIRFKDDNGEEYPDWESKTMGDVIKFLSDYTANGSFGALKENVKYFSTPNYAALVRTTDLEKKVFEPKRFTNKKGYDFLKKTSLFGGEIIMANVGSIGKVYKAPSSYEGFMTLAPNTYVLKFHTNIDEEFIFQLMLGSEFKYKLLSMVGSSTLKAINKSNLRSIKIEIPFYNEQKKIANFLSAIDKKIEITSTQIDKTKAFKKGLLQQMFV